MNDDDYTSIMHKVQKIVDLSDLKNRDESHLARITQISRLSRELEHELAECKITMRSSGSRAGNKTQKQNSAVTKEDAERVVL